MAVGIGLVVGGVLFRQMGNDPSLPENRRNFLRIANEQTWGLSVALMSIGAVVLVATVAYGVRLLVASRRDPGP